MNRLVFVAVGAAALICAGGGVAVAGNHPAPTGSPRPHDGHDYVTYSKSAPAVIPSSSCVATPTLEHTKPAPTSPSPTHPSSVVTTAAPSSPHTSVPATESLTASSSSPVPAPSGAVGTATAETQAPELANTGADVGQELAIGGFLLAIGVGISAFARRRRGEHQ